MAKLHWQSASLLSPVPAVLVSCGTPEAPNVLTIAWTGILCSSPPKTYISVRPERFSYSIIRESGEFVINLPSAPLVRAVDLCGVKSGREENKFQLAGLTAEACPGVSAPAVAECPISLPCRVTDVVHLGVHDMFIADILSVEVDEHMVNQKGRLDIQKCNLLAYAHGTYFELGQQLGTFGFSVRKKPVSRRPRKK
ncbi:MAG: flavin reductase family protein [Clostridiaceae bacterium]|nr:flavin reductase family protein [Clostridiaceae bacterium]